MIPAEGAESLFEYDDPGNYPGVEGSTAAVQYIDPTYGYRTVFSAVGFEGVQQRYVWIPDPGIVVSRYVLSQLYHNIGDLLRTGGLQGYLRNTQTQQPVVGARVQLFDDWGPSPTYQELVGSAISRADGSWRIEGVPPTIYILRVSHEDRVYYFHPVRDATCGGFTPQMVTIDLTPVPPGTVSGRVTELDGRTGIPKAEVCFTSEEGNKFCTFTAIDGTYSVQVAEGTHTYRGCASKEGYATSCLENITVHAGEARPGVNFMLGIPGNMRGKVTDLQEGFAIEGALVEVLSAGEVVRSTKTADGTGELDVGEYLIEGLAADTYDVRCSADAYVTQTKSGIQVSPNETTTVDFQLRRVEIGEIRRWEPGLYLMSLPQDYSRYDAADLLNYDAGLLSISLTTWLPSDGYVWYPSGFDSFLPGRGYWLMASEPAIINEKTPPTDVQVDDQGRYSIDVEAGWNMIGNPFPDEGGVSWNDVQVRVDVGIEYSIPVAANLGYIRRTLWGWDPEAGDYVQSTTIQPWQGYWMKSTRALSLLIPGPLLAFLAGAGTAPNYTADQGDRVTVLARPPAGTTSVQATIEVPSGAPAPPEGTTITLVAGTWTSPATHGGRFTVPMNAPYGTVYTIQVIANTPSGTVKSGFLSLLVVPSPPPPPT